MKIKCTKERMRVIEARTSKYTNKCWYSLTHKWSRAFNLEVSSFESQKCQKLASTGRVGGQPID